MKLTILAALALSLRIPQEGLVSLGHLLPAKWTQSLNQNQKKIVDTALDSTAFLGASIGAMVLVNEIGQVAG